MVFPDVSTSNSPPPTRSRADSLATLDPEPHVSDEEEDEDACRGDEGTRTAAKVLTRTKKSQLWAWYAYGACSEVFAVCAMTFFLPIALEQYARDNGYLYPSHDQPCVAPPDLLVPTKPVSPGAPPPPPPIPPPESRCEVRIWGSRWIETSAFSLYTSSAGMAALAVLSICIARAVDDVRQRHRLLSIFTVTGPIALIAILAPPFSASSVVWPLVALLAIIANTSYGGSMIAFNAYLPGLVRGWGEVYKKGLEEWHVKGRRSIDANGRNGSTVPSSSSDGALKDGGEGVRNGAGPYDPAVEWGVRTSHDSEHASSSDSRASEEDEEDRPLIDRSSNDPSDPSSSASSVLIPPSELHTPSQAYHDLLSLTTSRVSSRGVAIGYAVAISFLLLLIIPFDRMDKKSDTTALRFVVAFPGIVWGIGGGVSAALLPSRAGKSAGRGGGRDGKAGRARRSWRSWRCGCGWLREAGRSCKDLWELLLEARKLRCLSAFLAAWFFLSDGLQTIVSTAILFSKVILHMPSSSIILLAVAAPLSGIVGALLWPFFVQPYVLRGASNKRTFEIIVALSGLIPLYGCLGLIPSVREKGLFGWGWGGLTQPKEMYVGTIFFGHLLGAFQSYARTVFSALLPPSHEGRLFSLYSLTAKGSSFVGPLVIAFISDKTDDIRNGFIFLAAMVLLPVLILLWGVDEERGEEERWAFERAWKAKMAEEGRRSGSGREWGEETRA